MKRKKTKQNKTEILAIFFTETTQASLERLNAT